MPYLSLIYYYYCVVYTQKINKLKERSRDTFFLKLKVNGESFYRCIPGAGAFNQKKGLKSNKKSK